jgi:hypothetical protein
VYLETLRQLLLLMRWIPLGCEAAQLAALLLMHQH